MIVVRSPLPTPPAASETIVELTACRRSFSKLRWRGVAADGVEFGFDLEHSIQPGAVIHRSEAPQIKCYILAQEPEAVLEIPFPGEPQANLSLAWQIGNLHFPLQVLDSTLYTADDPAIRQMLDRLSIHYHPTEAVFQPLAAVGHGHGHGHGHKHRHGDSHGHHHTHDH